MAFSDYFARPFGGGADDDIVTQERAAIAEALSPAWSTDDGSQNMAEVEALALGVGIVWTVNERASGIMVPDRLMETLPVYEEAMGLRPSPDDSLQARRAAVEARMNGYAGNALNQIWQVAQTLAGSAFVGLAWVTDAPQYLPGLNPGPAGTDWSSALASVAVQLTPVAMADAPFVALMERIYTELQILCPVWMTFTVGTEEGGAVADLATADLTLVDDP